MARPWGSIFTRLAPNKRCKRLFTVLFRAWLMSKFEASPPSPNDPLELAAADSYCVRPRASRAITSASGSCGSDCHVTFNPFVALASPRNCTVMS